MKALLLIDLQIDRLEGGPIGVTDATEVIDIANQLMPFFKHIVASQQWHPADHVSFAANHMWRKPEQTIEQEGQQIKLEIMHCVAGSFGAEIVPNLDQNQLIKIVKTGVEANIDGHSAFFDKGRSTGLKDWLLDQQVVEVFIMGLGLEDMVRNTALDALKMGFRTHLIKDACKGQQGEEVEFEIWDELLTEGAQLLHSEEMTRLS